MYLAITSSVTFPELQQKYLRDSFSRPLAGTGLTSPVTGSHRLEAVVSLAFPIATSPRTSSSRAQMFFPGALGEIRRDLGSARDRLQSGFESARNRSYKVRSLSKKSESPLSLRSSVCP